MNDSGKPQRKLMIPTDVTGDEVSDMRPATATPSISQRVSISKAIYSVASSAQFSSGLNAATLIGSLNYPRRQIGQSHRLRTTPLRTEKNDEDVN
jgi:hypothetical protein